MADREKALERFSDFLDDRLSLKSSEDSKAIEASLGIVKISQDAEDLPGQPNSHSSDLEKGDHAPAPGNGNHIVQDPHVVGWDGDNDPENPMNFSLARKIWMSSMASFMTFGVSFASSVFSADTRVTAKEFNVSEEVMVLGVSLYVLGFACGEPVVPIGPIAMSH